MSDPFLQIWDHIKQGRLDEVRGLLDLPIPPYTNWNQLLAFAMKTECEMKWDKPYTEMVRLLSPKVSALSRLKCAAESNHAYLVREYLDHETWSQLDLDLALCDAASHNAVEAAIALMEAGANPNANDMVNLEDGRNVEFGTALDEAQYESDLAPYPPMIEALLVYGANPNQADPNSVYGHLFDPDDTSTIKMMVEAGLRVSQEDLDGAESYLSDHDIQLMRHGHRKRKRNEE